MSDLKLGKLHDILSGKKAELYFLSEETGKTLTQSNEAHESRQTNICFADPSTNDSFILGHGAERQISGRNGCKLTIEDASVPSKPP